MLRANRIKNELTKNFVSSTRGYSKRHEQAKQKAIAEFEKYRKMEMLQYESDYDRAIMELIQKENSLPKAGANEESEEA